MVKILILLISSIPEDRYADKIYSYVICHFGRQITSNISQLTIFVYLTETQTEIVLFLSNKLPYSISP